MFHCVQLRPLFLHGTVDTTKWTHAHHYIAASGSRDSLGDVYDDAFLRALKEEIESIDAQERDYARSETMLRRLDEYDVAIQGIVHAYKDRTRERVANVVIAYCDVILSLGAHAFADEYRAAALKFRESIRAVRGRSA